MSYVRTIRGGQGTTFPRVDASSRHRALTAFCGARQDKISKADDPASAEIVRVVDECVSHWTAMLIATCEHDSKIASEVLALQHECAAQLAELKFNMDKMSSIGEDELGKRERVQR